MTDEQLTRLVTELTKINAFHDEVYEAIHRVVVEEGGDWIDALADALVENGYTVMSNERYVELIEGLK